MDRVGVLELALHQGVPGLVISGQHAVLFVHYAAALGAPPAHLVAGLFQVFELDRVLAGHRRQQR